MDKKVYALIPWDSETGTKFQYMRNRIRKSRKQMQTLVAKYGARKGRVLSYGRAECGDISGLVFDTDPGPDWKKDRKVDNAYTPRLNTRNGKRIKAELDAIKGVPYDEISLLFGYDPNQIVRYWSGVFYAQVIVWYSDKKYIGLAYPKDNFTLPEGGRVVSEDEFDKIYPKNNDQD